VHCTKIARDSVVQIPPELPRAIVNLLTPKIDKFYLWMDNNERVKVMLLRKRAFGLFVSFISFALFSTYCDAKKPDVKSEVAKTTISGYVQMQFRATNQDNVKPSNTFTISRSRLRLDADLTDSLSTMFEISANTEKVEAEDLYLRYKISPKFSLKAGQLKKPFSYAQLKAARKLAIIERPICAAFCLDRMSKS